MTVTATGRFTQYSWDHRNRLTQVQERVSAAGAVLETVQYSYDAFDRRTIKRLDNDGNGTFERYWAYLNDGSHTILELEDSDGQGAAEPFRVSNRFLHGDAVDMVLADEQYSSGQGFQLGSTTANATQGTTLWTLGDNLGSIRDVVDKNGIVRQHVVYNAFGVRLSEIDRDATGAVIDSSSPAAIDTLFGYTGRDWDADTGLQYNRARWYDPAQGRWLSQDPIGFAAGDANLYRYVGNSATNATDPSGLAEGHHWTPLNVLRVLRDNGVITQDELEYFAGRMSGPGMPSHRGSHPVYDRAVECELTNWSEGGKIISPKIVVDNLRDGKSYDGNKVVEDIDSLNKKVKKTLPRYKGLHPYDTGTDAEVRERGARSFQNREKSRLRKLIARGLGAVGAAGALQDGSKAADIIANGEGMRRAREAFENCQPSVAQRALVGSESEFSTTFQELFTVNPLFALTFRKAVEYGFENPDDSDWDEE